MLTFDALRAANRARIPLFRNKRGELCHNADGSDWSLSDWFMALTGELGELGNLLKKIKRGDFNVPVENTVEVAKELADIQIYLDTLAFRCGVDLGRATVAKFNEVSDRVGAAVYLTTAEREPVAWMNETTEGGENFSPTYVVGWTPLYR